jgi:hypothetical protein
MVESFMDTEDRHLLLDMAMAWLLLAQQAERNQNQHNQPKEE